MRIIKAEQIKIERAFEGIQTLYSNAALFRTGLWDFRIALGTLEDYTLDTEARVVERYSHVLCLSPMFAKKIHQLLGEQLEAYENKFGKIPRPEDAK